MASETTAPKARRIRRLPADAEREILDAAQALLRERPFRELSVEDLMARTGMTRSSFYHYFRSLEDVAVALLQRVQAEMMEAAAPWIRVDTAGDPVESVRRGLHEVAAVYARHGAVLAAMHEAAFHHEAVEEAWREGVLGPWVGAIAEQIRLQRYRGVTPVEDADGVARALLLMNIAVFVERLGKQPPDPPDAVAETLAWVWVGALYPQALAGGS